MSSIPSGLQGPAILSVDDDPRMRKIIDLYLSKGGFSVTAVESGEEALNIVGTLKPSVILLDVMMPGLSGYEVCTRLQKNPATSETPVIFVTALGEEHDKARAFAVGAADYLVKPFSKEELLKTVRKHLETSARWLSMSKKQDAAQDAQGVYDFNRFRGFLWDQLDYEYTAKVRKMRVSPSRLYEDVAEAGVQPATLAQLIAEYVRAPYVASLNPKDLNLGVLSTRFCKSNLLVPLVDPAGGSAFALSNPFDIQVQDTLRGFKKGGNPPRVVITEPDRIRALFEDVEKKVAMEEITAEMTVVAGGATGESADEKVDILTAEVADVGDLEKSAGDTLVVKLANELISQSIQMKASDLHIEPREHSIGIRYRVDGMLTERDPVPKRFGPALASRFKILAALDIANRRTPQDGRIRVMFKNQKVDMRISTLPSRYGEKVVIRIQDFNATSLNFESLGFDQDSMPLVQAAIAKPHGIILVTGPTGSGKTTTLYTALQALNEPHRNIITVEDPIENELHRITQVQVHNDAGLTFPVALRSILRQDPDVIMVGEIRDLETADIAIKASLTGHLVLSTLHTNDAPGTVLRIVDMGVERFLVASSLELVLAQRLLRKLCPKCKKPEDAPPGLLQKFGVAADSTAQFFGPAGCDHCNGLGYKGRVGAFEILAFDETLREKIVRGAGADEIRQYARQNLGMTLLSQDALRKAMRGRTSIQEVFRVSGQG